MRTEQEINDVIGEACDIQAEGCKFPGMSFTDGVEHALRWALGESDESPFDD